MCNDNGDTSIGTFHNVIMAPDLCKSLFYIIMLINLGHTCLFHKGFCTVYLDNKGKNAVSIPHSSQQKHAFWGGIKNAKI